MAIDHLNNEIVTSIPMPLAGFTAPIAANADRTSIEYNTLAVTTGPVYYLVTSGPAPTVTTQMRELPVGGVIVRDGTGVGTGAIYIHAPAAVGRLDIVETS